MAINITRGVVPRAQKIVVYGPEGVGKTSFAATFPDPLFIDTEGGSLHMDVARFDRPASWSMLLEQVEWARANSSPGSTLVVDTLDWAERLCAEHVCSENKWASIEDPGYGKGYAVAKETFAKLLDGLTAVADRGVTVLCTAHARVDKFEPPEASASYDRWSLKLNDSKKSSVSAVVKEWCDALLFANYKTAIEVGQDKKARGTGGTRRVLFCNHTAAYDAKNRWGLPNEAPFEFAAVEPYLAGAAGAPGQGAAVRPAPAPAAPSAGGKLARLLELMAASDIGEEAMRKAVASQGYMPEEAPLGVYRDDLLDRLVTKWDAVKPIALAMQVDIPFS